MQNTQKRAKRPKGEQEKKNSIQKWNIRKMNQNNTIKIETGKVVYIYE